eukprot:2060895-Pleurochrysis_carterae.AAC.1
MLECLRTGWRGSELLATVLQRVLSAGVVMAAQITNIRKEDTAYGNRDAKFTVHWRFFNANR